jgi:hypothetical protein
MMKRTNKIPLIKMIMSLILFSGLICSVNAAEKGAEDKEEPKKITLEKTVSGDVSGISPNFIAILYGQDKKTSYEMALVIDKNTKVERKKSLKEIGAGDTVSVKYEETTQTHKEKTEKGKEKDITKILVRLAKVVSFVKAAPKELQSLEVNELPAPEQSEESNSEESESK